MSGCCRRHFGCTKSNWLFHDMETWRLYSPQYTGNKVWNLIYIFWRWLTAIYFLIMFVLSILTPTPIYTEVDAWTNDNRKYYVIYLTNWTYILFNISTILRAILATVKQCNKEVPSKYLYKSDSKGSGVQDAIEDSTKNSKTMQAFLTISWILYEITAVANTMVTALYWVLVYDSTKTALTLHSTTVHGTNAAFVLIDIWITAMPVRLLHFWIPMSFALLYSIFMPVYISTGGTNEIGDHYVYEAINWDKGSEVLSAGYSIAFIIAGGILHVIIFGIYCLKVFAYDCVIKNCCRRDEAAKQAMEIKNNEQMERTQPYHTEGEVIEPLLQTSSHCNVEIK